MIRENIRYYAGKIASLGEGEDPRHYAEKILSLLEEKREQEDFSYHIRKIVKLQESQEVGEAKRYALFPILDEKGYEFYQKQEITHWSEAELDFISDRKHYDSSTPQEKKLLDTTIAFFLLGDGVISKNIIFRFLLECRTYEEQAMFISQLHIELIHAATYGLAAFTFKRDGEKMAELIEQAENTPCVRSKVHFMEKWMYSDAPRYRRLVAFACAEGIFFCTLFANVFWFRSKGRFPNFIFSNELIANDESLHRDWGVHLFLEEVSRLLSHYQVGSKEHNNLYEEIRSSVLEIVLEAVTVEDEFTEYILSDNLEDLNSQDMKIYCRLVTNNLLVKFQYAPHFVARNPFTWLDDISMEQKGNFYEVRIGAYKSKSLADVLNWKKRTGVIEDKSNVYENPEEIDF